MTHLCIVTLYYIHIEYFDYRIMLYTYISHIYCLFHIIIMWKNDAFWFITTKVKFCLLLLVIDDENSFMWRHLLVTLYIFKITLCEHTLWEVACRTWSLSLGSSYFISYNYKINITYDSLMYSNRILNSN